MSFPAGAILADMPMRCWHCSEAAGKETMRPLSKFAAWNSWDMTLGKGADAICGDCARKRKAEKERVRQRDPETITGTNKQRKSDILFDSAAVPCYLCERRKPAADFDDARLQSWRENHQLHRAYCLACTPAAVILCELCERQKPAADFDAACVQSWKLSRNMLRAHCLACTAKARKLTCSTCDELKACDAFDPERVEHWSSNRHSARAECLACAAKHNKRGRGHGRHVGRIFCSKCKLDRPETHFNAKNITRWEAHDDLSAAVCVTCDPSTLHTKMQAQHVCNKCQKRLPLDAFDPCTWKRSTSRFESLRVCS